MQGWREIPMHRTSTLACANTTPKAAKKDARDHTPCEDKGESVSEGFILNASAVYLGVRRALQCGCARARTNTGRAAPLRCRRQGFCGRPCTGRSPCIILRCSVYALSCSWCELEYLSNKAATKRSHVKERSPLSCFNKTACLPANFMKARRDARTTHPRRCFNKSAPSKEHATMWFRVVPATCFNAESERV